MYPDVEVEVALLESYRREADESCEFRGRLDVYAPESVGSIGNALSLNNEKKTFYLETGVLTSFSLPLILRVIDKRSFVHQPSPLEIIVNFMLPMSICPAIR